MIHTERNPSSLTSSSPCNNPHGRCISGAEQFSQSNTSLILNGRPGPPACGRGIRRHVQVELPRSQSTQFSTSQPVFLIMTYVWFMFWKTSSHHANVKSNSAHFKFPYSTESKKQQYSFKMSYEVAITSWDTQRECGIWSNRIVSHTQRTKVWRRPVCTYHAATKNETALMCSIIARMLRICLRTCTLALAHARTARRLPSNTNASPWHAPPDLLSYHVT